MYTSESPPARVEPAPRPRVWSAMPLNIWALGLTSLLTDVSSEMITSALPLYVVLRLQWSPMAFGALDGAYQGVAALVRLGSGIVADRWQSHKAVALTGYAGSAVAKIGYVLAGTAWPALTAAVIVDRLGKGLRTAPRDALIAASAPVGRMGAAFGLHRTMDAAGAALGPALVFGLLAVAPDRFDVVFQTSFWIALTGVAAMALLVEGRGSTWSEPPRVAWTRLTEVWRPAAYRGVLGTAIVLAALSVSDAFLYLVLQRQSGLSAAGVPLLFVGTQVVYFALAAPAGALADRLGARVIFLAGHGGLLAAYLILALGVGGSLLPLLTVVVLGTYYAATDGVLSALTAKTVPEDLRATALGLLTTGTTAGRAAAALAFGALWTLVDTRPALGVFAVGLCGALVAAWWWLPSDTRPAERSA